MVSVSPTWKRLSLPPEFNVLRRWDVPGQVAAAPHPDVTISAPVEDEGRHANGRKVWRTKISNIVAYVAAATPGPMASRS